MSVAHFAAFALEGSAEIELEFPAGSDLSGVEVKPLSRRIAWCRREHTLTFLLPAPQNLCIEALDGTLPSFFLFAAEGEEVPPEPGPGGLIQFAPGEIHSIGRLRLEAGQTLFVPGGAVVEGAVEAVDAPGIRVCGRGIFDGQRVRAESGHRRMFQFERCRDLRFSDLLVTETSGWTLVLNQCQDVQIDRFRLLGRVIGGDGIDIVASSRVTVRDCMLRANDDCVVIKAFDSGWRQRGRTGVPHTEALVEDILVTGCALWNDRAGNAIEIGHELINPEIRRVVFRDCDILACHGHGAPLSINNAGHSMVRDILFEDIRIEHFYDFLIAFRIRESRWSHGAGRGQVRDVRLRDIQVRESIMNPGYSLSVIGGADPEHQIEDVRIENFRINDRLVLHPDAMDLYTRHSRNITFAPG